MNLLPLVSSFGVIALAELGDKTQITVMCLSANQKEKTVFFGAILAFALVDGVSALIGGAIAAITPSRWIGVGAGVAFLVFGAYSILSKTEEAHTGTDSLTFWHSFSLIALMELGDQTQLSVITLAAEYNEPFMIFGGVMMAMLLLTAIGVVVGKAISRFLPMRCIKIGSGLVFIAFGILFLFEATTGTRLF